MKSKIFVWVAAVLFVMPIISFGQTEVKQKPKSTEEIKIQTNLHCNSCKAEIESGLATVKGVKEAVADVNTKVVTVKYSTKKTNPDIIVSRIQKIGYQAKTSNGCCSGHSHSEGSGCKGGESGTKTGCGGHH